MNSVKLDLNLETKLKLSIVNKQILILTLYLVTKLQVESLKKIEFLLRYICYIIKGSPIKTYL